VEERFKRGITNAVDVHLARANVAAAESTKEQAAGDVDFSLRLLEVLVGQYPAAAVKTAEALPAVAAIPAGLPSTLLERRPDLRAARQRADADLKQLDASRKQWLPAFRLTANGGTSSEQLSNVLNAEHLVWSLAANATQPIFDGDRIAADIAVSEAELDTSVAEYHSTILDAFREVETALAADGYLGRQLAALERAADESTKAEAQALERYQQGLDDITSVLVAQRRSVDAQRNVIRTRNAVLQNRLDLCLALGGDFGDD
jgi:outer membrane protein TolC